MMPISPGGRGQSPRFLVFPPDTMAMPESAAPVAGFRERQYRVPKTLGRGKVAAVWPPWRFLTWKHQP
jgi:hypothetical protein